MAQFRTVWQRLYNVNQTHLVLAWGKLELQKMVCEALTNALGHAARAGSMALYKDRKLTETHLGNKKINRFRILSLIFNVSASWPLKRFNQTSASFYCLVSDTTATLAASASPNVVDVVAVFSADVTKNAFIKKRWKIFKSRSADYRWRDTRWWDSVAMSRNWKNRKRKNKLINSEKGHHNVCLS